jgi:hypothetical protein
VLGWLLSLLLALKLSLLTGDPKARADHVLGTFGSKSKSWLLEEGVLSALLWGCDGERLGPGPASRRDGTSSPRLCFWRVLHGLDLRAWCITNERTALSGLALVPLSEASMNMNFVCCGRFPFPFPFPLSSTILRPLAGSSSGWPVEDSIPAGVHCEWTASQYPLDMEAARWVGKPYAGRRLNWCEYGCRIAISESKEEADREISE